MKTIHIATDENYTHWHRKLYTLPQKTIHIATDENYTHCRRWKLYTLTQIENYTHCHRWKLYTLRQTDQTCERSNGLHRIVMFRLIVPCIVVTQWTEFMGYLKNFKLWCRRGVKAGEVLMTRTSLLSTFNVVRTANKWNNRTFYIAYIYW